MKRLIIIFLIITSINQSLANTDTNTILNETEKKYTLNFKTQPISEVLRALAKQASLNIILPDNMPENISISLNNVTLKSAIESILLSRGYNYKIENNILRVYKDEYKPKVVMEVINLQYANANTIAGTLSKMFSSASIQHDVSTNSLIIKDEESVVSEIKKIIQRLDVRTKQVLIEAKIVNATESFSRDLGIQWGGFFSNSSQSNKIFGISPNTSGTTTTFGTSNPGDNFVINAPIQTTPIGNLGIIIGSLHKNLRIDLALQLAEQKGQAKIVSSPKILTLDNKRATIRSGATLRIRSIPLGSSVTSGVTATVETINTGVELGVTPQITGDDNITLTVDVGQSEPNFDRKVENIPEVQDQRASTSILLKDGETVVIGGLYRVIEGETVTGIPFLSDLPFIGWLFKSKSKEKRNEELMIFLTPRIIKETAKN
ncbi:MAG: type IV pilus secretin PilQ [Proteobacteria bacterium]|nr:type IV pilus secretin PilQ [Pseudomonadota bacterium]